MRAASTDIVAELLDLRRVDALDRLFQLRLLEVEEHRLHLVLVVLERCDLPARGGAGVIARAARCRERRPERSCAAAPDLCDLPTLAIVRRAADRWDA